MMEASIDLIIDYIQIFVILNENESLALFLLSRLNYLTLGSKEIDLIQDSLSKI